MIINIQVAAEKKNFWKNETKAAFFCFFLLMFPLNRMGPDKHIILPQNCNHDLTPYTKHMLWVLKRTVSMRQFF